MSSSTGASSRDTHVAATTWAIYARGPGRDWVEWESYFSEGVSYPHYEIELRKVIVIQERVDV